MEAGRNDYACRFDLIKKILIIGIAAGMVLFTYLKCPLKVTITYSYQVYIREFGIYLGMDRA